MKAYGIFTKKDGNIYRTHTYMQFGNSDEIIGACVLCNPGGAELYDKSEQQRLDDYNETKKYIIKGELKVDPAMRQLESILIEIEGQKINGRFMIFNLFTLKDPIMKVAVKKIKEESVSKDLIFADFKNFELMKQCFPWLLVGWGVDEDQTLLVEKKKWIDLIKNSGIPYISKIKQEPHFYHVSPKIKEDLKKYKDYIVNQFKLMTSNNNEFDNKVIFPVRATKPNILVDFSNKLRYFDKSSWKIDQNNPNNIVKGYSNIFLKKGFKLVAYLYSEISGGNGIVYALPEEDYVPAPQDCEIQDDEFLNPPRPSSALDSFMEVIDGDRSPLSYLQAAMLYHELCEFGASWHGVSWGRDIMLPVEQHIHEFKDYEWEMNQDEPEIINPHFYYDEENNPIIVLYTINDIYTVTFNEYKHIFSKDNYNLNIHHKIIGTAGSGIIF